MIHAGGATRASPTAARTGRVGPVQLLWSASARQKLIRARLSWEIAAIRAILRSRRANMQIGQLSVRIDQAQREVREVYVGGFFGQLVSGIVWLIAAAIGTWVSPGAAMLALWVGGSAIFPLTTLALRLSRRPVALPPGHPMASLAMQIAFTVPIGLLLALAMAQYQPQWFFPASMLIVGAHYLPFAFLYGMRLFIWLAAVLVVCGLAIALWLPGWFSTGGWVTGIILLVFALLLRRSILRQAE